eukprot:8155849-Pyramimonas_sp.AAC.1
MGKYDDALPLSERSLAIREKVHHGEEHPSVANSLNSLAVSYDPRGTQQKIFLMQPRRPSRYASIVLPRESQICTIIATQAANY